MSKKITMRSSDGELFEIDEEVALKWQPIADLVEDCAVKEIPLANLRGSILAKVNEYCEKHVDTDSSSEESKDDLKKWDAEYINNMDRSTLLAVMMAANYLYITDLLHLSCRTVAEMISDKTPDEIRTILNIENDLTPEEEEQIRMENQWAFE